MKKRDYLAQLNEVLSWAHPRLAKTVGLEFKNCFGAVAGYVDGNIFVSCGKFGIALKLPPRVLIDLFQEPGVTHLKYFARGHVKKDYAVIPRHILDDRPRLRKLLDDSIKYAASFS